MAQELLCKSVESRFIGVLIATHIITTIPKVQLGLLKKGAKKRLQTGTSFALLHLRNGECEEYIQAPSDHGVVPDPGVEFNMAHIKA